MTSGLERRADRHGRDEARDRAGAERHRRAEAAPAREGEALVRRRRRGARRAPGANVAVHSAARAVEARRAALTRPPVPTCSVSGTGGGAAGWNSAETSTSSCATSVQTGPASKQSPVQPANTLPGSGTAVKDDDRAPARRPRRRPRRSPPAPAASPRDRSRSPCARPRPAPAAARTAPVAVASAVSERAQTPVGPRAVAAPAGEQRPLGRLRRQLHARAERQHLHAQRRAGGAADRLAHDADAAAAGGDGEPVRHLAVRADAIQPVDLDRVDAGAADELVADAVGGVEDVVARPAVEPVAPARRRRACRRRRRRRSRSLPPPPRRRSSPAPPRSGVVAAAAVDAVRAAEAVDAVGVRRPHQALAARRPDASPQRRPPPAAGPAGAARHDRGQGAATKRAHGDGSPRHATTIVRPPTARMREKSLCFRRQAGESGGSTRRPPRRPDRRSGRRPRRPGRRSRRRP